MWLRCFLILFFSLVVPLAAQVETKPKVIPSGYDGKRFFVSFMRNENYLVQNNVPVELTIYVGTKARTTVFFLVSGTRDTVWQTLPADTVAMYYLPEFLEVVDPDRATSSSLEIGADQQIIVYGMSSQRRTTDAYSAIPVEAWGRDYVVVSMPNDSYEEGDEDYLREKRSSQFMVIGSEMNTLVSYIPTVRTMGGIEPGQLAQLTLHKGQCFLVHSDTAYPRGQGDLSGTIVRADKPVAVLSGHVRAAMPPGLPIGQGNGFSMNHLVEMLPPVPAWSNSYASVPFQVPSNGDIFKVVCSEPNTTVSVRGVNVNQTFTLSSVGESKLLYFIQEPVLWTSNKPILVGQFMATSNSASAQNQDFDPCMVILPPVQRFVNKSTFQIPITQPWNSVNTSRHRIGIIAEPAALRTLTFDGNLVTSLSPNISTQILPNSNLHYDVIRVLPGLHRLESTTGRFSGILYGVASDDAYALPLGFSTLDSVAILDTTPALVRFDQDCGNVSGRVSELRQGLASGIFYVRTNQNRSFNFTASIQEVSRDSFLISASPTNRDTAGRLVVEWSDRAGNEGSYTYDWQPPSAEIRGDLNFGSLTVFDKGCRIISVVNTGTDTLVVQAPALVASSRVTLNFVRPSAPGPVRLAPGDSSVFEVCFAPQGDTSAATGILRFRFPCQVIRTLPISASVRAGAELAIYGHDFGAVKLGDTACARVKVVNTGTAATTIDSATFARAGIFRIDTSGIFPVRLEAGDSLFLPVCFMPEQRVDYHDSVVVNNQLRTLLVATLSGRGVAPLVASVGLDWGRKRVGTLNDSVVWLVNTGNLEARVQLLSRPQAPFSTSSPMQVLIPERDSVPLALEFAPDSVGRQSQLHQILVQNWRLHPEVSLLLSGEGILPTLAGVDTDFGAVKLGGHKDSVVNYFTTGGSDSLTVDSIVVVSGDTDCFEYTLPSNWGIFYSPSVSGGSVRYKPVRQGNHELVFRIIHDAAPAYRKTETLFRWTGRGIPADTTAVDIQLVPNIEGACSPWSGTLLVRNTGNTPLRIDSIFRTDGGKRFRVPDSLGLPLTVFPLQPALELPIAFEGLPSGAQYVELTVIVNDTIVRVVGRTLTIDRQELWIDARTGAEEVTPGEFDTLRVSGRVSIKGQARWTPVLRIGIPSSAIDIVDQSTELLLDGSDGGRRVAMNLLQDRDQVIARADSALDLSGLVQWRTSLPFRQLLFERPSYQASFVISAIEVDCFDQDSTSIAINQAGVCSFPLRGIREATSYYGIGTLRPNPADDRTNVYVFVPKATNVAIGLYNNLGERIFEESLSLLAGRNEVGVDLSHCTSGIYTIVVHSGFGTRSAALIKRDR